jgi:hypothetical protein
MGGTCSTHGRVDKCIQERYHSEDVEVDRKDLRKVAWEVVDWIHLSQDMYQWRALVNTVTNLRVPQTMGHFFPS